jgi:hypothetical protein
MTMVSLLSWGTLNQVVAGEKHPVAPGVPNAMTFDGRTWTLERTKADFSPLDFHQRFVGTISDDGGARKTASSGRETSA